MRAALRAILFDSDWSPRDLGSSLLAWWSADRADLITQTAGAVSSWKDVVAGYDAVQATGASQPAYSPTGFNGAPGLTFDGVDDNLTVTPVPALLPIAANPSEMWGICQQDALVSNSSIRVLMALGNSSAVARRISRLGTGGTANRAQAECGNGTVLNTATDASLQFSTRHVLRGIFGAAASSIAIDGGAPTSIASVPATDGTRLRIGAATATAAANFWQGKVRDLIITAPLAADQAAALLAWSLARRQL